jgi:hypothetical protein
LPMTSRRDYPLTSPSRALGPLVIVTSLIGSTDHHKLSVRPKNDIQHRLGSSLFAPPVKIAGEMVAEPVGGIFADVLALIFGGVIAEEFEFAKLLELIGSGEISVGAV